jgi:hypothetical protein
VKHYHAAKLKKTCHNGQVFFDFAFPDVFFLHPVSAAKKTKTNSTKVR